MNENNNKKDHMRNRNASRTRKTLAAQRELNTLLRDGILKQNELSAVMANAIVRLNSYREGFEAALFAIRHAVGETPGFNVGALQAATCVALASPPENADIAAFRRPLDILFGFVTDEQAEASVNG